MTLRRKAKIGKNRLQRIHQILTVLNQCHLQAHTLISMCHDILQAQSKVHYNMTDCQSIGLLSVLT